MNKYIAVIFTVCLLVSLTSCGEKLPVPPPDSVTAAASTEMSTQGDVDVDLTRLSSTLVYSEVYNMINAPSEYLGKTVRMHGPFAVYEDEATGKVYFAVLIKDATACCSSGIEFVLADEREYPAEYPALGEEITVSGVFGVYYEGETMYCQLTHAVIEK